MGQLLEKISLENNIFFNATIVIKYDETFIVY